MIADEPATTAEDAPSAGSGAGPAAASGDTSGGESSAAVAALQKQLSDLQDLGREYVDWS